MSDESPLPARTVTRYIAADLYATDGTGRRTVQGPIYVVKESEVASLLTDLAEMEQEIAHLKAQLTAAERPA